MSFLRVCVCVVAFVSVYVASCVPANAQAAIVTDIQNTLNTLHTYSQLVDSYKKQLEALTYDVRNAKDVPMSIWRDAQADIVGILNAVRQSDGAAYDSMRDDEAFRKQFPLAKLDYNYRAMIAKWRKSTHDSAAGVMAGLGVRSDQMVTEAKLIEKMKVLASGSVGHLQAMKTANQIAVFQLEQNQKLAQLLMMDMSARTKAQEEAGLITTRKAQMENDARDQLGLFLFGKEYKAFKDDPAALTTGPAGGN